MPFDLPREPFQSDGCSGGLSLMWKAITGNISPFELCCFQHDIEYHFGAGDEASVWENCVDRLYADNQLFRCVWQQGIVGKTLAPLIWFGVRLGGGSYWPTSYRWGFGWMGGSEGKRG